MARNIKAGFQQKNYPNITESGFEKIELPKVSAGRVKLEYTRPEGRTVADLYILSNETNACSIAHYYPENRSTDASSLFETVLNSFSFQ
jgi:hypothetical protein